MQQRQKTIAKVIGNTAYLLLIGLAVLFMGLLAASHYSLLGDYQLKTVTSGSMSPEIPTGSVVLIDTSYPHAHSLAPGQVITYAQASDPSQFITHRIVETTEAGFITQGDANQSIDRGEVSASQIVGRVSYSVPYVGYIYGAVMTPLGMTMLVLVPALILVALEIKNIYRQLKPHPIYRHPAMDKKLQSLKLIAITAIGFSFISGTTIAQFTDQAANSGNTFTSASWEEPDGGSLRFNQANLLPLAITSFANQKPHDECLDISSEHDVWHFIHPAGHFTHIELEFSDGTQSLSDAHIHPHSMHAYFVTTPGSTLISTEAYGIDGRDFFNLSHVCTAE